MKMRSVMWLRRTQEGARFNTRLIRAASLPSAALQNVKKPQPVQNKSSIQHVEPLPLHTHYWTRMGLQTWLRGILLLYTSPSCVHLLSHLRELLRPPYIHHLSSEVSQTWSESTVTSCWFKDLVHYEARARVNIGFKSTLIELIISPDGMWQINTFQCFHLRNILPLDENI